MSSSSKLYQRQRPLREIVADDIRTKIFSGEFPAGFRLIERDLAQLFAVSRLPVREALRTLHHDGLTESLATRGLIVRAFTRKEVQELFDIREALEGVAAGQAAQRATHEDIDRLTRLVAASQDAASSRDLDGAHDANQSFHDELIRLSGNGMLQKTLAPVAGRLHWLFRQVPDFTEVCRQHLELTAAIGSGNTTAAAHTARTHVAYYREQTGLYLFHDDDNHIAPSINGQAPIRKAAKRLRSTSS